MKNNKKPIKKTFAPLGNEFIQITTPFGKRKFFRAIELKIPKVTTLSIQKTRL
jgi:hypothetical protein